MKITDLDLFILLHRPPGALVGDHPEDGVEGEAGEEKVGDKRHPGQGLRQS